MKGYARLRAYCRNDDTTQAESLPPDDTADDRGQRPALTALYLGLVVAALLFAHRLWLDNDHGWRQVARLESEVAAQQAENGRLETRNAQMRHDIISFKSGTDAVEERARSELGMIRSGETFVQMIGPEASSDSP